MGSIQNLQVIGVLWYRDLSTNHNYDSNYELGAIDKFQQDPVSYLK